MTHRVVFLQSAADDLFEIRRYVIKHFSPSTWLDAYAKIKKAIVNLERFPAPAMRRPSCPSLTSRDHRRQEPGDLRSRW